MNPSMCPKSFVWNFTFQWYFAFIRRFCQVCSTSPCGSQGCGPGNSVCSANDYTWNERCARPTGSGRSRKQKWRTLENCTGAQTPPAGSPCGSCGSTTGTCEDSCSAPQRSSPGSVCQRVNFELMMIVVLGRWEIVKIALWIGRSPGFVCQQLNWWLVTLEIWLVDNWQLIQMFSDCVREKDASCSTAWWPWWWLWGRG